jgi:hypothetical protein
LAILFCALLAAGAWVDFGEEGDLEDTENDNSETTQERAGMFALLFGVFGTTKERTVTDEGLGERLLGSGDPEWVEDDQSESAAAASSTNENGRNTKLPPVITRLTSVHTSQVWCFFVIVFSTIVRSALAIPLLVGALWDVVGSFPNDDSRKQKTQKQNFATRKGPRVVLYVAAWCVLEFVCLSVPGEAFSEPFLFIGRACGFARSGSGHLGESRAGWFNANPVRVFVLFSFLCVAARVTKVSRTTPDEQVFGTRVGDMGDDEVSYPSRRFVRLDVSSQQDGEPIETLDDSTGDEASDSRRDSTDRSTTSTSLTSSNIARVLQLVLPTTLWLVALTKQDLIHALVLCLFVSSLSGNASSGTSATAKRIRVAIAACFLAVYASNVLFAAGLGDHFDSSSSAGAGGSLGSSVTTTRLAKFLTQVGLYKPDPRRDVTPLAIALLVAILAARTEAIELTMKRLREMENDQQDENESPEGNTTSGWQTSWNFVCAIGDEIRAGVFSLVDGRGAYLPLLVACCAATRDAPSFVHLVLLTTCTAAALLPDWKAAGVVGCTPEFDTSGAGSIPGGDGSSGYGQIGRRALQQKTKTRWRVVFALALGNFGARYFLGAFPVLSWLGLDDSTQQFVVTCVGIPAGLNQRAMYRELFLPSLFLVTALAQRNEWFDETVSVFRNDFRGNHGTSSGSGRVTLPCDEHGFWPFVKRLVILHATKPLIACSVTFAVTRVDLCGLTTLALALLVSVAQKNASSLFCETTALAVTAAALAEYAFSIPFLYAHLHRHGDLLRWVGVEGSAGKDSESSTGHQLFLTVLVLLSLETVRVRIGPFPNPADCVPIQD